MEAPSSLGVGRRDNAFPIRQDTRNTCAHTHRKRRGLYAPVCVRVRETGGRPVSVLCVDAPKHVDVAVHVSVYIRIFIALSSEVRVSRGACEVERGGCV